MNLSRWCFALTLFAVPVTAFAADWKPAPTPLMTKWGKQVTPENAWQEYPRPQLVRKDWQNLNGLWNIAIVEKGVLNPKPDGQILVPYPVESALSGVGKSVTKDQVVWYSRTFEVPAAWKRHRVLLHFGAVDWEATVTVNGKELGTHRGGSDPFSFDITDALKDGPNELTVRVWDPTDAGAQPRGKQVSNPHGIWYTPVTGIWQTVWLEPVGEAYVTAIRSEVDVEAGRVTFHVGVANAKPGDTYGISVKASPNQGTAQPLRIPVGKPHSITLAEPNLWTPDSPNLYEISVYVQRGPNGLDRCDSYFAFRKISVGKDKNGIPRMMLNNEPVFQVGPLDQGWWPDGLLTPPSDAAMKYDLEVLKKMNFNMLRKHIKVEPARLYYHCDKLGLLVWQDMPSGMAAGRKQGVAPNAPQDAVFTEDEKKQFRTELQAMIDHLRFFPCIVVWVPFNEGWGQHDTNDILKWVKEYDPTRLVNGPSGWADRGYGDMKDMHNYPGPGMFPTMPERVSVLGEFGGLGLPVKGHLWKEKDNWGYQSFKTEAELRQRYRQLMLRMHPLIGQGLSAAVYTQTTDVEVEVNGLMTYDREVIKFDVAEMAAWHKALHGPPPEYRDIVPTSQQNAQKWRYSIEKPATGWEKAEFDAAKWAEAEGGFGTKGTPGSVVRTEWKSADIWLRREVELKAAPKGEVFLQLHHDEDAEVFINGVLAAKVTGYVSDYTLVPLSPEARKGLKAGTNKIAVHCHQTQGGQYIDVGLAEIVPK